MISKSEENKKRVELFLDSGAFSAWMQGITINIYEYIDFIKQYHDLITVYANLDVIGDPQATWRNQMIMENAGLKPLPCFHYGTPEKWLLRYLGKGYDYIALGGMVAITTTTQLMYWLDRLFQTILTDNAGMPKVKIHGFGITSLRLMLRYPWYSVDSTTWVVTGRRGIILVPKWKNNQWVYDENSWKVIVSTRSPSQKEAGKHLSTLTPKCQEIIFAYFEAKKYAIGKSEFRQESEKYHLEKNERWYGKASKGYREVELLVERGLCNDYKLRDELNIIYFLDLEKTIPEWPWPFQPKAKRRKIYEFF